MSTPGVSLFQGTESINVNTSIERAEEEEALEDQRRRNEELENLLQNAFDDLDDDETTIDSTTNFQSGLFNRDLHDHGHNNEHRDQQGRNHDVGAMQNYEEEIHQLKMLLESRNRDCESIKKIANDELKKCDELQKRLTITEAELDRALSAKKNTHELLVESKEKCSNLESTIAKLKADKKALETENNTLLGKLETSQSLLSDIQRKYDMVERDLTRNNDRNAELKRKHADERHRAEIEMMQQQIDQIANKLEKKCNELENMNTRYRALQNSHETMLVDKASKINDLNNALNEAQSKCEELLSKQDYFQENVRLQKLVANLQDQIHTMEKTIATLNERLEFTTAELDVMDSVLHQHNLEDTPRRLSQTQGRVVGSTPLNTVDRVGSLKDELYRALANVKTKREDIRRLQRSLEERQSEIKQLKEDENKALVQITTLNDEKNRLENRLKILEEENEELRHQTLDRSKNRNELADLRKEITELQEQSAKLQKQRNDFEKQKISYELECKQLNAQLRNVEVDLEVLQFMKKEHESMRQNYEQAMKENQNLRNRNTADALRLELERHKFLLKDAHSECDRLKNLYVDISNAKETLSFELEKMRALDSNKVIKEEREKVENLQRALQLAEVKSSEMTKILEAEKQCHEREIAALQEKLEKERANQLKEAKNTVNNCSKCIEYFGQITKYEIDTLQLKNQISHGKKEIDALVHQLNEAKQVIMEMSEKLKLSEQQEQLITELKTKAQKFEEYVKSQSSCSSEKSEAASPAKLHLQQNGIPTTPNARLDKSSATSPQLEKHAIRKIEARIRDEMAKIFAIELKRFKVKLYQAEEQNLAIETEYKEVLASLQQRQTEVDLLKQAILAERENFEDLLNQKQNEFKEQVQKQQNAILQKTRDELHVKNKKINDLTKELQERQTQIEAERKSMKAVMSQWEAQRKNIDAIEQEWKEKVEELKKIHDSAISSWQSKYNSAKRTAANYKRYAEDKEAHMLKEYDRIKFEYDTALAKIEVHMREAMEKKNAELKAANAKANKDKNFELADDKENQITN